MLIHNYSSTGEYLNTAYADECQIRPGTHLVPAHATTLPMPPLATGEAAVFDETLQAWSIVPDHRGKTVYDSGTGAEVQVADLGTLAANLQLTKPAPSPAQVAVALAANKTAALAAIDQFHANTVQGLAGNPTQVEKDTWAMKLATANAVVADTPVSGEGAAFMTPMGLIAAANATAVQVSTADAARATWAAKVQANAAKFAGLVGVADALRTRAKAAVTAAVDQAGLDAAIADNKAAAQAAIVALG